ncbi:hypothetical protein DEI92_04210 [Curtobacterium sp. MCBD17_034]|nr:hypothetical protein DEI82_07750 [Curtobacterium sp. MCBD17_019]PZF60852.1 hypothetical protein DEI92_04210 [Curtobacterium sp. MCBD17_034]PZM40201.1 hypothetical protein DEI90_00445 [Curtobacterium sp. MCBD17_031]
MARVLREHHRPHLLRLVRAARQAGHRGRRRARLLVRPRLRDRLDRREDHRVPRPRRGRGRRHRHRRPRRGGLRALRGGRPHPGLRPLTHATRTTPPAPRRGRRRVRWQTDAVTTTTPPTLANFREVGGPGFQAGRTRTVYRSNTEDVPATAYPVVLETVVDLRRGDEVAALAHPLRAAAGYRNVPLFDPAAGEESAPDALELRDQYVDWLVRHRATMLLVFRALAETEGDVLVCCSAGKDRTGVVSALLARLWGADLDRIGADYAATGAALADRFARERAEAADAEHFDRNARSEAATAVAVVEHVEERFLSVRGYLRWLGLSDREVDRL